MNTTRSLALVVLSLGVAGSVTTTLGQAPSSVALSGRVTSQREGAMEGVVVIAKREGSRILTSVTTDAKGHYRFPKSHLDGGLYTIAVRAAGYVLPGADTVEVRVGTGASLDLVLNPATTDQLAHQLTNVDWLTSMPGTAAQKDPLARSVVGCGFCHDLERVLRSTHAVEQFLPVIQRMLTYAPDNSSACGTGHAMFCDVKTLGRVQRSSAPRPLDGLSWYGVKATTIAQYLASVNLSGNKSTWSYPLRAAARPKGPATRAIVTVYPVPRQPSVIHDLAVDAQGNVWYGDSGWGYLGKLDPKSGRFSEYQAPANQAIAAGRPPVLGVQDVEVDLNGHVWARVGGNKMVYFDPTTEKWSDFAMPVTPWAFLTPFHRGQTDTVWTTGRAPRPDGSSPLQAYRLNFKTREVSAGLPIMVDASGKDRSGPTQVGAYGIDEPVTPICYQIERDPQDNLLCADFYGSSIISVDAKTGVTHSYPTPTPHAGPRRGRADDAGHFWFAEFFADKVGLFDVATRTIREFPMSSPFMAAYGAAPDRNGEGWASSNGSDRVARINPKTGTVTEYLMPVYYDARKVVVDPSTRVTTVWLPNKNLAQLIRIEVQE